uniref:Uncharacterized protein n=1 Tax=Knipowitschia caucasica TaxID=637954 RepID=A0AAV2JHS2_KNICA
MFSVPDEEFLTHLHKVQSEVLRCGSSQDPHSEPYDLAGFMRKYFPLQTDTTTVKTPDLHHETTDSAKTTDLQHETRDSVRTPDSVKTPDLQHEAGSDAEILKPGSDSEKTPDSGKTTDLKNEAGSDAEFFKPDLELHSDGYEEPDASGIYTVLNQRSDVYETIPEKPTTTFTKDINERTVRKQPMEVSFI